MFNYLIVQAFNRFLFKATKWSCHRENYKQEICAFGNVCECLFCFSFQSLLELHKVASAHDDAQLTDFLEGEFLKEQVEAQKEIGDLLTKMKRGADSAVLLHMLDKELL